MKKIRYHRIMNKVIAVYSLSLLLFVAVVLLFSYIYQYNYLNNKMEVALNHLDKPGVTVTDAVSTLRANGYDIQLDGKSVDLRDFSEFTAWDNTIKTVVYYDGSKTSDGNDFIVVNGYLKVLVNFTLLQDFMSNLYIIIISTVILYLAITLLIIQYFVFKIINPIGKINNELKRISNFDFDGKLNINTNDEISILADNVENIKISLRSYNRNRATLVNALVHELKSPVATISSVLQLNKMGHESYGDAVTREIIEENIETISEITKISLEIFEKQTIYKIGTRDILELIRKHIDLVKPKLDEKKLNVVMISENSIWKVDEECFGLIISNLLTNICNYSAYDSDVNIFISENVLTFTNTVADNFTSGTGKGLKIISSLLSDMNMSLEYYEKDKKYNVIITKKQK